MTAVGLGQRALVEATDRDDQLRVACLTELVVGQRSSPDGTGGSLSRCSMPEPGADRTGSTGLASLRDRLGRTL
jgi:hypothetical protein